MRLRFHSEKWFYGLTLSAMSMTNLFIGPVMGAIYDHTHQTKIIVVTLLLFQIGGVAILYNGCGFNLLINHNR